jgi:pimeloyl-ACP methyl ester carboxylesterase
MSTSPLTHRRTLVGGLLAALAALAGTLLMALPASSAADSRHPAPKPTVVLVHGAFADASGWTGVVSRLQKRGYPVIAPANPLRSVAGDAAYLASVLATIDGPIVLVGHSYGGEVITNAATGNANVKALVYIAAFAPDQGETSGGLANKFPGTGLTPQNLVFRPYPGGTDGYINPAVFHAVFCADLPTKTADAMAAEQRPGSLATLGEPSGPPAWKTIPSWYLVANQDQAIPAAAERFMADRMGAHAVEIDSSHVAMISHPDVVTQLITAAADATG